MKKNVSGDMFANAITKEILSDPKRDVTTIKVDLRCPVLRPEHAKVMRNVYLFLQSNKSCN